jgi:hypothetical protein
MAGPFKCQIFLQTADAGWTETYYAATANLAAAQTNINNLLPLRMALSRTEVTNSALRVSDMSNPRTAILSTYAAIHGTYSATSLSTVDPAIALMVRMFTIGGTQRSRHFLRGIPSDQLVGSATDPLTWSFGTTYNGLLNSYIGQVTPNFVLVKKTGPGVFATTAISSMAASLVGTIRRAGRPFVLRRGRRLIV